MRIGLAGGGSDIPAYVRSFEGNVLNATFDKYVQTSIVIKNSKKKYEPKFVSIDLSVIENYSSVKYLSLHKAVYDYFDSISDLIRDFKQIEVYTYTEIPHGSGLGGSSTLTTSLVKAFDRLLDLNYTDYDIAKISIHIERTICNLHGGMQDQVASSYGGVNFIKFYKDLDFNVIPININSDFLLELQSNLLLFYTGKSRFSDKIISDQEKSLTNSESLEAMHQIKNEAINLYQAITKNDINLIHEIINHGWEEKKKTSTSISNSAIDEIINTAKKNKASAAKVSGAGGGGFILFFVDPIYKFNLKNSLPNSPESYFIDNIFFDSQGAKAWII